MTESITLNDQKIASAAVSQLEDILQQLQSAAAASVDIHFNDAHPPVAIPKQVVSLLLSILSKMAEGKSIAILPTDAELTTQQAADLLNISRPHFVNKLLKEQVIPSHKVGSHRRVKLQDLLAYQQRLQAYRESQLQALVTQAQDLNMGYK